MAENCTKDSDCADWDTCGRYKCDTGSGDCYLPWGSEPCNPGRTHIRGGGERFRRDSDRYRGFSSGLWFNFNNSQSDSLWFNAQGDRRKVTVRGNIDNVKGAVSQARSQGLINDAESGRAEREINTAISQLVPTPDNPSGGRKLRCKKKCSSSRGRGKCALRGCLNIHGFPPKEFSWTWEI